jgi:hypothetical protein
MRLKEGFTPDELKSAIDGFHTDPWHSGENPEHKVWLDLDLLLRDAGKVEAGVAFSREPKTSPDAPRVTVGGRPVLVKNGAAVFDSHGNPTYLDGKE